MPAPPDKSLAVDALRGPLVAALERHLIVYWAGGETEAHRLIEQIAEEVLRELDAPCTPADYQGRRP